MKFNKRFKDRILSLEKNQTFRNKLYPCGSIHKINGDFSVRVILTEEYVYGSNNFNHYVILNHNSLGFDNSFLALLYYRGYFKPGEHCFLHIFDLIEKKIENEF
jgi:hypothetical protein